MGNEQNPNQQDPYQQQGQGQGQERRDQNREQRDQRRDERGENRGQSKTYVITKPGEQPRTVTQQQWKDEKLGQQGWQKPDDLDENAPDDGGTPGVSGTTI